MAKRSKLGFGAFQTASFRKLCNHFLRFLTCKWHFAFICCKLFQSLLNSFLLHWYFQIFDIHHLKLVVILARCLPKSYLTCVDLIFHFHLIFMYRRSSFFIIWFSIIAYISLLFCLHWCEERAWIPFEKLFFDIFGIICCWLVLILNLSSYSADHQHFSNEIISLVL